jgi:hypothetical protein
LPCPSEDLGWLRPPLVKPRCSRRLKLGAVKMGADGGLSAPVFWTLDPYRDRPDFFADPFFLEVALRLPLARQPIPLYDDIYRGPIGVVDRDGRVREIRPAPRRP